MITRFEQFSYAINGMYRFIHRIQKNEMVKRGYKGVFAIYLATLKRYEEGLSCARLCDVCDKDKAAVSRIISEMEEKGLVERINGGERGYGAKVILTEKGKEVADFVSERARIAVDEATSEIMTEGELNDFNETLEHLYKSLQEISEVGIPHKK